MLRVRFGDQERELGDETVVVREDQLPIYLFGPDPPDVPLTPAGRKAVARDRALNAWAWWPWGSTKEGASYIPEPRHRRYATYIASFGGRTVRFEVTPTRVLDQRQYLQMVHDLLQCAPAGLIEPDQARVGLLVDEQGRPCALRELLPRLVTRLRADLAAAQRIARRPFEELGPLRPGEVATPHRYSLDRDLPENRVALAWVRGALRTLEAWLRELEIASLDLAREIEEAGEPAPAWTGELAEEVAWLQDHRAPIVGLIGELRQVEQALERVVTSAVWTPTPAVRRRADPGRLARSLAETPAAGVPLPDGAVFSALSPRTAPFVFELWAAHRIAAGLTGLGFEAIPPHGGPSLVELGRGLRLPRQSEWSFQQGDLRLRWFYGPRARRIGMRGHALHLSRRERVALQGAGMRLREAFLSHSEEVTPDYALCLERGGRVAWVVADAIFGGPDHPDGVVNKLDTVQSYGRHLLRMDRRGRPVRCRVAGSFVVVPGDPERWRVAAGEGRLKEKLENLDVVLLPLLPGGDMAALQSSLQRIIETLEWAAEGGLAAVDLEG